ncbi:tripartite tricarboxylate transporter permease [Vibrio sp. PP-XX7]
MGNLTLANIFVLIFGLTGIKIFSKLVTCPKGILIPLIIILSVVGSYAINNSLSDVWWMLAFGVMGYFYADVSVSGSPGHSGRHSESFDGSKLATRITYRSGQHSELFLWHFQ